MTTQKKKIIEIYGKEPNTLDELAHSVIAVINSQKDSNNKQFNVVGFSWDISHSQTVSCSHNAPQGCNTNWGGLNADGPRSYPGWYGRVWIRYAEHYDTFSYGPITQTLTYPGTGGSGTYDGLWTDVCSKFYRKYGLKYSDHKNTSIKRPEVYSWDYRFFDLDWPLPIETTKANEARVWAKLNDYREPGGRHIFIWEDPETKAADEKFLLEK